MTSRPARSSTIPIPRSSVSTSPTRNIESVISIPFTPMPRPQSQGSRTVVSDDHRGVGGISTSPVRPTARSFTQTAGPHHFRAPSRSSTAATYEPRIIRADSSRNIDPSCLPSTTPSPARPRRTSTVGTRAPSAQRTRSSSTSLSAPISFPRPSYLEHSSFKHLLQTEAPINDVQPYSGARSPSNDSDEDSNVTPPPRSTEPTVISVASSNQMMRLPTRWSIDFRHQSLNLSDNGRELSFAGASCNGERDAAAARSVEPIPPACGVYYYEVEIHSKGQKAHISVGFSGTNIKLSRLPGWEATSWGYHGDDGCSFAAERNGTAYGPTFGLGDIIGCGIDFSTHRAFFTKNGTVLGSVFENVGKGIELYPAVGLQNIGESIKVNFGHESFRFDIDFYVQQQRQKTWTTIMSMPLNPTLFRAPEKTAGATEEETMPFLPQVSDEQCKETIDKLVLSYLAHHGYVKTATAFQKQAQGIASSSADDDIEMDDEVSGPSSISSHSLEADIQLRTRIVNSVLSCDIDSALTDTQTHYPGALEAEEGLMLVKLRCRKFVELVLETAELEKKMKAAIAREEAEASSLEEDGMGMDVDDDDDAFPSAMNGVSNGMDGASGNASSSRTLAITPTRSRSARELCTSQYEAALHTALSYGQTLDKDYKATNSSEAKNIFVQTFAILTSSDPLSAGGAVGEVAGHEARVQLANELNQAILRSQGRPVHPALEMMYRQTAVCLLQLGLARVGAAAFANMQKEFLET